MDIVLLHTDDMDRTGLRRCFFKENLSVLICARLCYLRAIILFIALLLCSASVRADSKKTVSGSEIGIRIIPQNMEVRDDSVRIDLKIMANGIRIPSEQSLSLVPELHYKGKRVVLPPVVLSGSQRARFDRREETVDPDPKKIEPYHVWVGARRGSSYNLRYRVSIPYASWMEHASLILKQVSKDCCTELLLANDVLTKDINLTPPCAQPGVQQPALATVPAVRVIREVESSAFSDMVNYLVPKDEPVKVRTSTATAYIDYPKGVSTVVPSFGNNKAELSKVDVLLQPLLKDNMARFRHIQITGYSSPDGAYYDNEALSKRRSEGFKTYLSRYYDLQQCPLLTAWVGEDWEGLRKLVNESSLPYKKSVNFIIDNYGIFEGRERYLMELDGGAPYKELLRDYFPKLRRIELMVAYEVRNVTDREASQLLYTHPELLSLEEIMSVSHFYRPGTVQFREVYEIAANLYPDDITANVNAAAAVLLVGDTKSAHEYLDRFKDDPRAYNNYGVLCFIEGNRAEAEYYFRKALKSDAPKARENLLRLEVQL